MRPTLVNDPTIISPGMIGLTKIDGRTGLGIRLAQEAIRWRHPFQCPYQHTFNVLDKGQVIEAMPGGAIITPISYYLHPARAKHTVYIDLHLNEEQAAAFVREGWKLEGTPYNFATYYVLALKRFGISTLEYDRMIANKGFMMCSQMSDEICNRAGIHLYQDRRLAQNVIPWDLWNDFFLTEGRWPKT